MKIYVLPADAFGCGHYRLIWPANVLQNEGHDVVIMPPQEKSGFMAKVEQENGRKVLKSLRVPEDADVLVLQRPAHELQPQLVEMCRHNGIAVVVDMDDNMSDIHHGNIAYHVYSHNSKTPFSWRHALESCKNATLVTTSTKTLQKVYARPGRGAVLDNYVPEACLGFQYNVPERTFGWAGTTKSHPNDLQITGRVVKDLMAEGFHFKVVGGQSAVKDALRLDEDPDVTGSIDLVDWIRTIGQTYQVGMIPLAPTAFNTSKSRLKGIEHMAVGIPWVSSPREEYRRLNRESGCGLLVERPKEWYAALKRLLTDEVLRKEQQEMGWQFMKTQTYQANAWRWAEAWTRAYEIQKAL